MECQQILMFKILHENIWDLKREKCDFQIFLNDTYQFPINKNYQI